MDKILWNNTTEFHGHECPGIAMGFKICEAAIKKLDIDVENDDLACVAENKTCSVDAVRFILKCTTKNKKLSFNLVDKQAFSFWNKTKGKKLRIELKDGLNKDKAMDRVEFMNYLLDADIDDILVYSEID